MTAVRTAPSHHCSTIIQRYWTKPNMRDHSKRKLNDRKFKKILWKRSFKALPSACKADGSLAITVQPCYRCAHNEVRHKKMMDESSTRFDLFIWDPLVAHSSRSVCLRLLFKQRISQPDVQYRFLSPPNVTMSENAASRWIF